MKKIICFALILILALVSSAFSALATEKSEIYPFSYAFEEFWYTDTVALNDVLPCKAAILIEASTGRVLFAQNENAHLPIASVTKIMSTLLVIEAIDSGKIKLDDKVTVGADAAKMGGSQVYLEVGEQMTVHEMLKALVVVSANDATVAMAEHICGSEASFVAAMNERAKSLGMTDTHFENCHGLNDDGHYSSARDVSLMTRELLKHEKIFDYTTIWMDTIRDGKFGLANTNKLIRFYSGANGMKTGFTDVAKYCLSGTAKRNGMQLVSVIIGAETGEKRFEAAKKLLDFGFANYAITTPQKLALEPITVMGGTENTAAIEYIPKSVLSEKGSGT
ncbi:MAG: D-alanyl-D-alanine carboxypeptidase family protein, partial [Clostridia bacterium]